MGEKKLLSHEEAVAAALKFDLEHMTAALAAATSSAGGNNEMIKNVSTMKAYNVGRAGQDGISAALIAIGADMLVPMHHDLYEVNRVRPSHFVDAVETLDPFRKYHIFAPGELYIKE